MYNMICFVSIYAIHNLEILYLIIIGDDPDAPSLYYIPSLFCYGNIFVYFLALIYKQ